MENLLVTRVDLINRARLGFGKAGRGVVAVISGETEPRYASRAEIKERLAEEQADPGILAGVLYAADKYDPKWQAGLVVETPESCTVSIVGFDRSEIVASVSFTTTH